MNYKAIFSKNIYPEVPTLPDYDKYEYCVRCGQKNCAQK